MQNGKFVRELLKLLPAFGEIKGRLIFEPPVEHILVGFAWEKPRGGIYIYTFVYPLFDMMDFIHLGYSDRLRPPAEWIPDIGQTEQSMAEQFVQIVEPYRMAVSNLRELSAFVEFMRARDLQNPLIRRGFALSLIVSGDQSEARVQLELCLRAAHNREFELGIVDLIRKLDAGIAAETLLARELKFRAGLRI